MGGFGSGRPGWRRKCEHLPALDVRVLACRGSLVPGMYCSWAWSRGDEPAGNIGVRTAADHVRLIYKWTPYDAEPQQFDYQVWIERTPCHYGGSRRWFRCPRCDSRRAVLYGVASDGRFGCRHCMPLGYASEAESRVDRINRKLHKLQAKLGDEGEKPKWMRWQTFERICERCEAADQAWGAEALARFAPLLAGYMEGG